MTQSESAYILLDQWLNVNPRIRRADIRSVISVRHGPEINQVTLTEGRLPFLRRRVRVREVLASTAITSALGSWARKYNLHA